MSKLEGFLNPTFKAKTNFFVAKNVFCEKVIFVSSTTTTSYLSALACSPRSHYFCTPLCQFHQHLRTNFLYECHFFYVYVTRENNVRAKKNCTYNIDEIDTLSQTI